MFTDGQIIAKHFADNFNLKFTQKVFIAQIGQANILLKLYSKEDIIDVLDYLREHPPKKGLSSLAYLQYIINDILPKAKARKLNKRVITITEDEDIDLSKTNVSKSNNKILSKNNKIKF
jgi:hypothetical protein